MASRPSRWASQVRGLLLALAAVTPIGLSLAVGYRALSNEEAAREREAQAQVEAAAGAMEAEVRASLERALVGLDAIRTPNEGALDVAAVSSALEAIRPSFAASFAMSASGELILPAKREPSAARTDPKCTEALGDGVDIPRTEEKRRRDLLAYCADARGPLGRLIWPRYALEEIQSSGPGTYGAALTEWMRDHASTMRTGERSALRRDIESSNLDPKTKADLVQLLAGRGATEELLRVTSSVSAQRALAGGVGTDRWAGDASLGVVRRTETAQLGFVVTRETLLADLRALTATLPPTRRLAVSVDANEERAEERFSAVRRLAPGLVLRVRLADRAALAGEAATGRIYLAAATLLAAALVAGVVAWLVHRARLAQRTSDLRTTYVAALAHELRTPVASMRMLAELLDQAPSDDPEQRELTSALAKESVRLSRTVEKLGALSGLFRPDARARRSATAPLVPVTSAIDAFRETHPDVEVVTEVDDVSCAIDADLVELAVSNLLDNALKYAPEGAPFTVSVRREPNGCRIGVSDRGPGVPLAHQSRIFSMFERVDDRLSKATEGMGLGLALVAAVAKAHGGTAWVESDGKRGAAFFFTIRDEATPLR